MTDPETRLNSLSVRAFINSITDDRVRADCAVIADIMEKTTNSKPKMWAQNIVGFGTYKYRYANGKEMDRMLIAFSPRKQNITLYLMPNFEQLEEFQTLLPSLGKHSTGKSCCLYINRLSDIRVSTLKKIIKTSIRHMQKAAAAHARKIPKHRAR